MTIGERIKELRAEANLRQSELGKAIGFSGQVVSNVERGYSFPSTEFVNRSAACFGVPADYILGRTTSRYAVADPKEVSAVQARIKARLAQLQMSLPDLIKKSTLTEETCCDILAGKTVPGIDALQACQKPSTPLWITLWVILNTAVPLLQKTNRISSCGTVSYPRRENVSFWE